MIELIDIGVKRAKLLNPDFKFEDWHFDVVKCMDSIPYIEDYTQCDNVDLNNFDVTQICGTGHYCYYGLTWLEMLGSLQRFSRVRNYSNFSSYINRKDDIYLAKIDNSYYITSGNHRFCVAKFLKMPIMEVFVTKFVRIQ